MVVSSTCEPRVSVHILNTQIQLIQCYLCLIPAGSPDVSEAPTMPPFALMHPNSLSATWHAAKRITES